MATTTLAQILRRHWAAYVAHYGADRILPSHHAAVAAILSCHTPQCGGSVYRCACGGMHFTFHGCGHRACPQCGQREAQTWIECQTARLFPVPYHLVTFTVPEQLRLLIRSNQRLLLDLLFKESAATLQDVAHSKLRADLGFLGALRTWSRQLIYHPHVHYVIPALGLSENGSLITPPNPDFLLPVEVLSARFRSRFRRALQEHPALFAQVSPSIWRIPWVVHSLPVGSGKAVLTYLSRYIYRTALSSERALLEKDGFISFRYRDSITRQIRCARLPIFSFLARFLQHVLPKGFRRVRVYGWLSPAAKKRFQRIRVLLDLLPVAPAPEPKQSPAVPLCPLCKKPLQFIGSFGRAPPPC